MGTYEFNTTVSSTVIDELGSLQKFYSLTNQLSKTRHVRFTNKLDEADNIEWHFKYRGHQLTLQYNIYSGVTLTPQNSKDVDAAAKIAGKLKKPF
jgi:hypothetical protein